MSWDRLLMVVAVVFAVEAGFALITRVTRASRRVDTLAFDWGAAMHEAAEAHLTKVNDAAWLQEEAGEDFEVDSPAMAPFCGCETCVVREVIVGAWPVILRMFEAHKENDLNLEVLEK